MKFPPITKGARYSVIFLFVLSIALAGASYAFSLKAINRTASNRATITQLCMSGNEFRHQQVILWTHLVAISKPPPHESVQARTQRLKTTRAFIAYVQHVFAPRNCQHPGGNS